MKTQKQITEFINTLNDYEGFIRYSHRPLQTETDIFIQGNAPHVDDTEGFIIEGHFCNGRESITINQVNDKWYIDRTDINDIAQEDIVEFLTFPQGFDYRVKMAQIWQEERQELCENFPVRKLKKIVFAGFQQGDRQ